MAFSVQMPELGESVTEGTVTRWLKQVGESVEKDEPLLEVSTDKVDTEIPSPVAGTLQQTVAGEDDTVEVGGQLGVIDDGSGGDGSAPAAEQAQPAQAQPAQAQQQSQPQPEQEPAPAAQAQQAAQPAAGSTGDSGSPVTMPELGESVTEGTVTRWLKQVGESVEKDEPLLEVSTDKVDTEIPSPMAGTLLSIAASEDDTVEVGGQLATIGGGSGTPAAGQQAAPAQATQQQAAAPEPQAAAPAQEPAPAQQQPEQQPAAAEQEPAQQGQTTEAPAAAGDGGTSAAYVTPLVRKLAQENGVDLATVTGSGVGGRIRKQDVLAAAEPAQKQPEQPAAPAPARSGAAAPATPPETRSEEAGLRGTTQKASRIRQITAKTTREALQASAQLTQTFEVDVTRIARLRSRAKAGFGEREGVSLTYLPFFAKAAVEALKAHPNVNASYDEESSQITYHDAEHLGIAVDTDRGLLSPVIHNAGDLSLGGLARAIADLAERTRARKVTPDELSGATFTITNIGSQGGLFDTPILAPPQGAMLATGAIVKRPAVISGPDGEDSIAIRSMCYLPLTYDHRLIDGADAGRFLATIKHRLEEGAFENDLGL